MYVMFISGLSGGLSSILGKIALTPNSDFVKLTTDFVSSYLFQGTVIYSHVAFLVQVVFFSSMLYLNAIGLSTFLRALETRGSLPVTVVCSAVNFLVTGTFGAILLGEKVNQSWCLGAGLIMAGITFIMFSQGPTRDKAHR